MPYELVQEENEAPSRNAASEILRHPTRIISNLGTRAIGLPGDVLSLVNSLVAGPATKAITGSQSLPYEETYLGKVIPTTEQHRKGLEKHTGEYLKPQNQIERFVDDIFEDAALLATPGGTVGKAATKIGKAASSGKVQKVLSPFLKSVGVNLVGHGAESFTGEQSTGDAAKLGAFFLASLIDKPRAARMLSSLYKTAEEKLPTNAAVPSGKLERNLDTLQHSILKGRNRKNIADSEEFVLKSIDKARDLVENGEINIAQAWAQKRSLNEDLIKKLYEIPQKEGQGRAKKLAKQINHFLNDAIREYGAENPEFYTPFKKAEEGFGTLARSNLVSKFMEKNLKYSPATAGLLHFLGGPIGSAAAGSVFPYQVGKLGYRIFKSPTLRKHYLGTLKAAAQEDIGVFNKQLRQLDDSLQKEESNDNYEFID